MSKVICMLAATVCFVGIGITASAQDLPLGAGRVEISAAPGGGVFFMESTGAQEPQFKSYALNGSITFNANRWVGFEGDFGFAIGVRQNLTFGGTDLVDQKTPHLFGYSGNVIVNPMGSDRALVPYAAAGLGGMTILNTNDAEALGIMKNETYLMTNVGGGLKWFAARHWGVRGDYRLMVIRDKDTAPEFFGRQELRYGHRVYGALLLTY
jgi:hypothetical protein